MWHALYTKYFYNSMCVFRTLCGCRVRVEMSSGEKRSRYRGPPPSWNRRPRDDYRRRSPPPRRRYCFFFLFLFFFCSQTRLEVLITLSWTLTKPIHLKFSYGQNDEHRCGDLQNQHIFINLPELFETFPLLCLPCSVFNSCIG